MSSWVRYSVAVYAGLLLAGALMAPRPQASIGAETMPPRGVWVHSAVMPVEAAQSAPSSQTDDPRHGAAESRQVAGGVPR